jgi:FMN phosphatase YigB (HAD superfamily)
MASNGWYVQIITNTFKPLLQQNEELPAELAPKLLHRFWSNEGYELQPGVQEALRHLRDSPRHNFDSIVVGVVTNSDPRVPDVLSSLGLSISPLRYGHAELAKNDQNYDIDFSVMSYDVGHEKPEKRIFQAAEEMLDPALKARGDTSTTRDLKAWERVYVGDEYDKDVVGARNAGWHSILISEEPTDDDSTGVKWLEDKPPRSLMSVFGSKGPAVGFASLNRIADWLRL